MHRRRVVPDGHPGRWDHTTIPEGWAGGSALDNPLATVEAAVKRSPDDGHVQETVAARRSVRILH